MKKYLLILLIALFANSCKKDEPVEVVKTDISVSARTDFLIWSNTNNLNQKLNEIVTYNYGDAIRNEINKSIVINNDTTSVTVSINFKEEFQQKYYDPNLSNNLLTIHLQKNIFVATLPSTPNNYNTFPTSQTPPSGAGTLPNDFELNMPPSGDQAHQGSCSAWAVAYGMQSYYRMNEFNLSYTSNGTLNEFAVCSPSYVFNQLKTSCNTGIQIFDALNLLKNQGVCSLEEMPYNEYDCSTMPNSQQISYATENKITNYATVPINSENIKNELYANHPVVIAVHLHEGFYAPSLIGNNYVWTQTNNGNAVPNAYHAMVIYGWNNDIEAFKVLNSWGDNFCNNGSIWIGYEIFNNYTNIVDQAYIAHNDVTSTNSEISITPSNFSFPDTQINTTSSQMSFTVSNTGSSSFSITGFNVPNGFTLVNGQSTTVNPNSSVTFFVTFHPTSIQNYSGSLEVINDADNANSSNSSVYLSGNGVNNNSSSISLSGNLNFGNVEIGSSSTRTFTISNTGNQSFYVSSIDFPSNVYSANWNSGTINANSSQTVSVTFHPTNQQSYNGNVNIINDANTGNGTISISGNGVNPSSSSISLSGTLNFGNVNVGNSSTDTFTIHNTGNQNFYVSSIDFPSNVYSANWNSGTINGNSSQTVTVTFQPTNQQPYNGVINVISDANTGNGTISISGSGINNSSAIPITPTNNCSNAPTLQVNTEYIVNLDLSDGSIGYGAPIEGESYNGANVQGFWLEFNEPSGFVGDIDIKIYDVSNNFDPVIGRKFSCGGIYYTQWNLSTKVANEGSYGASETFAGHSENNGYTHRIRIYHYYGNQQPNISFKIKIETH